jgi:hypothetical protein
LFNIPLGPTQPLTVSVSRRFVICRFVICRFVICRFVICRFVICRFVVGRYFRKVSATALSEIVVFAVP